MFRLPQEQRHQQYHQQPQRLLVLNVGLWQLYVDAVDEAGAEPDPHAVNPITIAAAIANAISFLFICYNLHVRNINIHANSGILTL